MKVINNECDYWLIESVLHIYSSKKRFYGEKSVKWVKRTSQRNIQETEHDVCVIVHVT